jgi:signal transduction histidine kinase
MRRWLPERLTPLQWFSTVSFVCVVALTVIVCWLGADVLSRHLIEHDAKLVGDLACLLLRNNLPIRFFEEPSPDPVPYARVASEIATAADVIRVVLYDPVGRVLWSDEAALVGQRFAHNHGLAAALRGRTVAHVGRPSSVGHKGLRATERVEEIYVPVRYATGGRVVGALEIYRQPPAFFAVLDRGLAMVWLLGGGGGLALYLALLSVASPGPRASGPPRPAGIVRDVNLPRIEAALRRLNDTLEAEAGRIARELHDEAGQLLAAAHIALQDAMPGVPAVTQARLRQVSDVLDQVEEDLRRLAHELRPRLLDDLGLEPALEFLAAGVARRSGLEIHLEGAVGTRLPPVVETTLYRVVKEGLTNAVKHAHASTVVIRLAWDAGAICCSIADDGNGFDLKTLGVSGERGLGLLGVQNRVEGLGGNVAIVSAPGHGTTLTLKVPVAA